MFTLAIVGRPNVGKSTLFNRLVGKRLALVHDRPGVTRDRREAVAMIGDVPIRLIDTAGLGEVGTDAGVAGRMREQTQAALAQSDAALFVLDARAGVTAVEREFLQALRKFGKPLLPVANKCEGRKAPDGMRDIDALGLGEALAVSAEHGEGMIDLYRHLSGLIEKTHNTQRHDHEDHKSLDNADASDQSAESPIRIAVVGRPNAGKSTLINRLLGHSRLLTGSQPGLTRDAIRLPHCFDGRDVLLIDTAGMRRRSRISDTLERAAVGEAQRAIRLCQVAVLVLDAAMPLDRQDLRIARHIAEEGRAMIVAVNKIDRLSDHAPVMTIIRERLDESLPQMRGVAVLALSALGGQGVEALGPAVVEAHAIWGTRVPTAQLNDWLNDRIAHHEPPLAGDGRRVKPRYITQIKTRPPTFTLFVNRPDKVPESYRRFLINGLRRDFGLRGIPLRLHLKKGKNPYI